MILQSWYEYGNTFGMHYLFDQRGDGLAMHTHPPGEEHNVIVLRGSVQITGRGVNGALRLEAPTTIDELPEYHEITALEPQTELLNIYKNGKPASYVGLPESEKSVRFESRPLENPL